MGLSSLTQSVEFTINNQQIDNTPPNTEIQFPENNSYYNLDNITVRGIAYDTGPILSGIQKVFLRYGENGNFSEVEGTENWSTNISDLQEGTNSIYVYSKDIAGNTSQTNSIRFIVDFQKPYINILTPSNNQIINTNVIKTIGIAYDNLSGIKEIWLGINTTLEFSRIIGTTNWETYINNLEDGTNIIYFYGIDNSSNFSETNEIQIIVSTEVNTIVASPQNYQVLNPLYQYYLNIQGVSYSHSLVDTVFLKINNGEFNPVSIYNTHQIYSYWYTNILVSDLLEGTNELYIYSIDNISNISQTNIINIIVDKTPPTLNILSPTNNQLFNTTNIVVEGICSDNLSEFSIFIKVNTNNFEEVKGSINWSTNINTIEGTNEIYIYAIDSAWNSTITIDISFLVDITPPIISIFEPSNNYVFGGGDISISGYLSDNLSGSEYILIKGPNSDNFDKIQASPGWITNLNITNEGTNNVYIFAVDKANNISQTNNLSIIVAKNVYVSITNLTNNQFVGKSQEIKGLSYSYAGIKRVMLRVGDVGDFNTVEGTKTWNTNLIFDDNKTNTIYFYAIDEINNHSTTNTINLISDITPPSISIISHTNNQMVVSEEVNIYGSAIDNLSGIDSIWVKVGDNGSFSKANGTTNWNINIELNEGSNKIYLYAIDLTGNISLTNSITLILLKRIYVAINGNDANEGISKDKPLKSLELAVNKASYYGLNEIYVSEGIFSKNNGLGNYIGTFIIGNNLEIIGGWDSEFNSITGYTIFDGINLDKNILINSSTNIILKNLIVKNSKIGIEIFESSSVILTNIIVLSNTNNNSPGGGIKIYKSSSNKIFGIINNNYATSGGGIELEYSDNNIISSEIVGNSASIEGGGIRLLLSSQNIIEGTISQNTATSGGGGIHCFDSHNNFISATIHNNTSQYRGGGILLNENSRITIKSKVFNNTSEQNGGGINIEYSKDISIDSSLIYNNTSEIYYDGLHINSSTNILLINSLITNNDSQNILLYNAFDLTISNNYIGGNNDTNSVGIYEANNITNHKIIHNKFITNSLKWLYRDYQNGFTNDINAINSTLYSGASEAIGNILTNIH